MSLALGLLVRKQRELIGWSQEDVAIEIGKSQQYIALIEAGKRDPSIKCLGEIADCLELDYRDLIKAVKG